MSCALAILAGGKGERLGGVAKGLLRQEGRTLISRQLELRDGFDEVLIVADDPLPYQDLGVRIVPDVVPGRGAPGGVHAALVHARTEWVFVIACDMPFVTPQVVALFLAARTAQVDVVASDREGRLEPLPSVWRRSNATAFGERLAQGPSLRSLCEAFPLGRIPEGELARIDPLRRASVSINLPRDLAAHGIDGADARKA